MRSSNYIPPGTVPTPVISPETMTKANCSFLMTGMTTERTEDTFKELLLKHINEEDKDCVTEIKLKKKNMAIIYCRTWDDCNRIVRSKKEAKFQDEKVFLSLFSENKPTNS